MDLFINITFFEAFMKLEKLDKVVESLKKGFKQEANQIVLENKKILIDKACFRLIKETVFDKKVGFVDGGNGEILGGANFSIQLIKIYYSIYQKNKRVNQELDEFVILVNLKNEKEIYYEVHFFDRKEAFKFNAFENEHLIKPSIIGEKIRKIFEIKKCIEIIDKCDFIVRDGDLEINDYDKQFYEELFESCKEKKRVIAGLSKTSTILCNNGLSAGVVLNNLSKLEKWYYKNNEKILFVKLHKRARHVFRLDMKPFNEELISLLAMNSIDLTFPGYPYALIEVDKMARVRREELERMKLYILSKYEKELDAHLASIDAHNKLNIIS